MKICVIIGIIILITISGCISDNFLQETPKQEFPGVDCSKACIEYGKDNNLTWSYCSIITSEKVKCGFRTDTYKGKNYKIIEETQKIIWRN